MPMTCMVVGMLLLIQGLCYASAMWFGWAWQHDWSVRNVVCIGVIFIVISVGFFACLVSEEIKLHLDRKLK